MVKEYVIKWREEDRTMPKAAVMKLQEMRDRNNDIDAWLDRTKNPVAAVGRLQRQYAKP